MRRLRLISLFLTIVVVLVACGGTPTTPASNASAPAASEAAGTASDAASSAAADASAADASQEPTPFVVQSAPPAEAGKTQVVWWYEGLEEPAQQQVQQLFIDSFEAANPDIDLAIVYQGNPQQLSDALRTAVQAGAGPDIIQTSGPSDVAEFVRPGFIAPLDAYATQFGWDQKIFPWALEVGKVEGKLYSVPLTYETMVLFYNKKVFADNNLQPPTNRAELEATAKALQAKNIWPFANSQSNAFILPVLMSNYAGADNVYRGLKGELPWTDPLLVEPVNTFNTYMQNGWISGNKETYFSTDYDTMMSNFGTGKGGMLIMGTWAFIAMNEQFADNPNDWDWVQFPALRDGVTPSFDMGIGSTLSINARSKNPNAAAKVLDWVYNDPARAAAIIQALPGEWVVPIDLDPALFPAETDPRFTRALQTIADASKKGDYGYLPWTFWSTKSADVIYTGLDPVFTGEITPEAWGEQMQETFAADLQDGKVPTIPPRQ